MSFLTSACSLGRLRCFCCLNTNTHQHAMAATITIMTRVRRVWALANWPFHNQPLAFGGFFQLQPLLAWASRLVRIGSASTSCVNSTRCTPEPSSM